MVYGCTMSETVKCIVCGEPADMSDRHRRYKYKTTGRAYCTPEHAQAWRAQRSSETMSRTNRQYASQRMRERNPMKDPEVRVKVSRAHKDSGWAPPVRGGNGAPVPEPQRRLAHLLGWPTETTVVLNDGQAPMSYNLDITHPYMKVCVEVDGRSHDTIQRQSEDQKRDRRLQDRGWLVFRFSNLDAMEHTADCARAVTSTTSKWTPITPTRSETG